MVLAVHDDLGEALGERGLCLEERQFESSLQIALGEAIDESQLFFVGNLEKVD